MGARGDDSRALAQSTALIAVLVVAAPPAVARGLRVALGRVLPLLLAAQRGQVEQGPDGAQRFHSALGGEVGAIDLAAVAQEHREAEQLAVLVPTGIGHSRAAAKIDAEVVRKRRDPGNLPA